MSITSQDEKNSMVAMADAIIETETPPALVSVERLTFVVTGAASGIGAEIRMGLVQSGADRAIVDVDDTRATRLATQLVAASVKSIVGVKITAHSADVSAAASINTAIEQILAQHGKIDRLVTCADTCENRAAVDYPPASIQRLWAINVDGTYLSATAIARHLIQRKAPGSLIFIGSIFSSVVNVPHKQTPYNMSKAGVRHMAATLAVEWADVNIRVNCVSPGCFRTLLPFTEPRGQWIKIQSCVELGPMGAPMRRLGRPDEVLGSVLFLASKCEQLCDGSRDPGGWRLLRSVEAESILSPDREDHVVVRCTVS